MNKLKIFTENFLNNLDRAEYNGGSASLMVSIIVRSGCCCILNRYIHLFGPISIILILMAIAWVELFTLGVTGK